MINAQSLINQVFKEEETKKRLIFHQPKSFWNKVYKNLDKEIRREFK